MNDEGTFFDVLGEWIDRGVTVAGKVVQADLDVRALKTQRDILLAQQKLQGMVPLPTVGREAASTPASWRQPALPSINPVYVLAGGALLVGALIIKA